ncbi:hypothetical protein BKA14_000020 [Actinoplanes abujensis]|uniref:Uncharacterized protein n=1 Tax=Paractinoplanes abujensis TaxID=882441 RepID=A0A7W7FYV4_9ACTN|nr:hypothetical protein [Actinoplanes abujensis]
MPSFALLPPHRPFSAALHPVSTPPPELPPSRRFRAASAMPALVLPACVASALPPSRRFRATPLRVAFPRCLRVDSPRCLRATTPCCFSASLSALPWAPSLCVAFVSSFARRFRAIPLRVAFRAACASTPHAACARRLRAAFLRDFPALPSCRLRGAFARRPRAVSLRCFLRAACSAMRARYACPRCFAAPLVRGRLSCAVPVLPSCRRFGWLLCGVPRLVGFGLLAPLGPGGAGS